MASQPQTSMTDDGIAPVLPTTMEMTSASQGPTPEKLDDPFLVTFSPQFDASNPKDWPTSKKWAVTDVMSATGFNRIMVSTIMAPALSTIASELNMSSTEAAMALSIYLLATAFGPLVIGPLSEVYGRKRVLHASNVWFLVWNIVCGFAKTKEVLIASRFMAGFGASSIYALAGGVLGDIWRPEQRGRSLAVYLLIPLLGAAVGPIIGGFMAGRTTWRWMFWSTSLFQGVMILVSFTVFRETYAPVILKRKAEALRRNTSDSRYYTVHERMNENTSVPSILAKALSRPLRLLMFHPLVQIVSVLQAFIYGLLYVVLSSFADVWIQHYQFPVELSGLHYIALALGEIVGSQFGGRFLDLYRRRCQARVSDDSDTVDPEHRLKLAFPGLALWPLALVLYGWTAQYRVHWSVVDLGIFLMSVGTQLGGIPISAYVIEAYGEHTSSAIAATQFPRSLAAFLFPLFAPKMYQGLGYGWGNTVLALVGFPIGAMVTFTLWHSGKRLRLKNAIII
jgi:multidrug resistance protein